MKLCGVECMRMLGGLLSEMLTSFQEIRAGNSGKAKLEEQIAEKSFTKGSKIIIIIINRSQVPQLPWMFQKQVGWGTWLHQLLTCQANIRDIVVNHRCTHQNPWWYISGKIAKDVITMQVQEKLKSTLGYCFDKFLNPWWYFSWPDQEFTKARKEVDQKKKTVRCKQFL